MVFQKKGIRVSLLCSEVGFQKRDFNSSGLRTYSLLPINAESAPVYNSCQRKPSSVMMNTLFVFCWPQTTTEIKRKAVMKIILMAEGLGKKDRGTCLKAHPSPVIRKLWNYL